MLVTGRSLSLVSALVALTLFVIMETSVVSSYSAYVPDAQLEGKGDGEEVQEGFDGERNESDLEKPKLIRVPLWRVRYQHRDRRSIDTDDERINEYERNGGYGILGAKSYGSSTTQGHKQIRDTRMSLRGGGYGDNQYIPYRPYYEEDRINEIDSDLEGAPVKKILLGNCHGATRLFQHDLNLDVYRSTPVQTIFQFSIDESDCIACIFAQPRDNIKSSVTIATTNGSGRDRNTMKLMVTGSRYEYYEHLRLDVQVYVIRKSGHSCDPI